MPAIVLQEAHFVIQKSHLSLLFDQRICNLHGSIISRQTANPNSRRPSVVLYTMKPFRVVNKNTMRHSCDQIMHCRDSLLCTFMLPNPFQWPFILQSSSDPVRLHIFKINLERVLNRRGSCSSTFTSPVSARSRVFVINLFNSRLLCSFHYSSQMNYCSPAFRCLLSRLQSVQQEPDST